SSSLDISTISFARLPGGLFLPSSFLATSPSELARPSAAARMVLLGSQATTDHEDRQDMSIELYWEDFTVGRRFELGSHEVTREEVIEFAQRYDPQPFHIDEEAAGRSVFGGLIASGWHTASMVMRMMCDGYLLRSASLGSPGVDNLRWVKPV